MNWEIIPIQKLARFDTLTYKAPKNSQFLPGQLVYIPLRNTIIPGIIFRESSEKTEFKLREIQSLFDLHPILNKSQLNFCQWMAENYISTLSEITYQLLPAQFRKVRKQDLKNSFLPSANYQLPNSKLKILKYTVPLYLQGSMKERFLKYKKILKKSSGQTLILTPDIKIVPKTILEILPEVFLYHTETPKREIESWKTIFKTQPRIILGSHKALLLPIQNLETIILEQENHPQIQYDQKPYYNLRETAIFLAKKSGASLILGSNFPSLATWKNIQEGILKTQKLIFNESLAKIKIFSTDPKIPLEEQNLSFQTENLIAENLKARVPTAILILRKGYAWTVLCKDCLNPVKCPKCESPLKLEKAEKLFCPICKNFLPIPEKCSICQSSKLKITGLGQLGIENYLKNRFPKAQIQDSIKKKFDLAVITPKDLGKISRVQDLILLRPETLLFSKNYNIKERLQQIIYSARMLCKILYIETQIPENIFWEKIYNPEDFLKSEFAERKKFGLPPTKKILQILGKNPSSQTKLLQIKKLCLDQKLKTLEIFGPATYKTAFTYQLLLKIDALDFSSLTKILKKHKEADLKYILDPQQL